MSSIHDRYESLKVVREDFIQRAIQIADLTIPARFRGDYDTGGDTNRGKLVTPNQSVGARGVRNLSAKLQLTLIPPNEPFFKYSVPEEVLADVPEGVVTKGTLDQSMDALARTVHNVLTESNLRIESEEALMSLIMDGNPLMYVGPDLRFSNYKLDQYCIQRDRSGRILEIVLKETFSKVSLPQVFKDYIELDRSTQPANAPKKDKESVDVYTHVLLKDDGKYHSVQEVCGKEVVESITTFPKGILPWIAPRAVKVSGEHYGHPIVEEIIGDLTSLDQLEKSLLDMSAVSSRILFMVDPASRTQISDFKDVANGGFIPGTPDDIRALQANLQGDFQVVATQAAKVEGRLEQSFLLVSSIQRNAERVTAEEIRLMATELDNALGGVFTLLAAEFQRPLLEAFQWRLKQARVIQLPDAVEFKVVTGLEALGRGQDIGRLSGFVSNLGQLASAVPGLTEYINPGELTSRLVAAHGIDTGGLVKTEEQLAQERQQTAMQQQLQQGPLGEGIKELTLKAAEGSQEPQTQQ